MMQCSHQKDTGAKCEALCNTGEEIGRRVLVLSGKGGVGKSTVAVNLARNLCDRGFRVGLLDIDIHGPSVPTMLGIEGATVTSSGQGIIPVDVDGLKVISIAFFLDEQDTAIIWRGPRKMGAIKQFIEQVEWGTLDFLIVDAPPGTGDEPLSVVQLLKKVDGAYIITSPQKVAAADVRKSISFCRTLDVPILGVVENMSGFRCPHCGETTDILSSGGGQETARTMGVDFLGSIPLHPRISRMCDEGKALLHSQEDKDEFPTLERLVNMTADMAKETNKEGANDMKEKQTNATRIAIPLANGKLAMHFGHCESFALIDTNDEGTAIANREDKAAPAHEPGLLPKWLGEMDVNIIIAGGMGQRAQNLFTERGIKVLVGAPAETPEEIVERYLSGKLQPGENFCDH